MIRTERMLKLLEGLREFLLEPRGIFLYDEIRKELLDDIREAAAKNAGRGKALDAAKKILASSKKGHADYRLASPHVVDGVQSFCNGKILVSLDKGCHLPFEPYGGEPTDYEVVHATAAEKCRGQGAFDREVLAGQAAALKADGKKENRMVYSFGDGDAPAVPATQLAWAAAMLGGVVECRVGGFRDGVVLKGEHGRAVIMPVCRKNERKPLGLGPGVHAVDFDIW